jgi:hypothetical protein
MIKDFKVPLVLLLVVLILFLGAYSVFKYNNEEKHENSKHIFYSLEKGVNMTISFLHLFTYFNWFKSEVKRLEENKELVYDEVEEVKPVKEKKKNIDLYQLVKKSLEINNWSILWKDYWKNQSGWFNKELKNFVN